MVADCFSPAAWFGRVSARRPTHFLLLRQKKVSKEKASRSPGRCAVPCAARSERGRAELAFGSDNARPDPFAPALLSPATRHSMDAGAGAGAGTGTGFPSGERASLPFPLGDPRGEGNASPATEGNAPASFPRRHALASSAGLGGTGRALSERSEFSPTPPGPSNAACPQRSGETAHPARFSFAYFSLAKQRKVSWPPGLDPAKPISRRRP